MSDNPHIGMKFSDYLDGEGVRADVEGEALTRLASIMAADQADTLAAGIGAFYARLIGYGMKPRAAEALTATYSAMVVAQHFGVNVGESFAVGPMYGMED